MKTALSRGLLLVALLSPALVAQPASFSTYGSSCSDPNGRSPQIGNRGLPRLGSTFTVTYAGPNILFNSAQQRVRPWLMIGLAQAQTLIPPVFRGQPTGCFLWTSSDIALPMPPDTSRPAYRNSFDFPIPNDARLLGAPFYLQWLAVFEQCGAVGCDIFWVLSSKGGAATIGT